MGLQYCKGFLLSGLLYEKVSEAVQRVLGYVASKLKQKVGGGYQLYHAEHLEHQLRSNSQALVWPMVCDLGKCKTVRTR